MAFGSWENNFGHLAVGVDMGDSLSALLLVPADEPTKREPPDRQQQLIVRFLIDALRDAGAKELTEQR